MSHMWDLGSLLGDGTHVPCLGRWVLNCWTTREVPQMGNFCFLMPSPLLTAWPLFSACPLEDLMTHNFEDQELPSRSLLRGDKCSLRADLEVHILSAFDREVSLSVPLLPYLWDGEDDNRWRSLMSSGYSSEGLNEDSRLPSLTHSSFYLSRCSFPAWLLLHLPLPIFKAPKEDQGPSPQNPLRGDSNLYMDYQSPQQGFWCVGYGAQPRNLHFKQPLVCKNPASILFSLQMLYHPWLPSGVEETCRISADPGPLQVAGKMSSGRYASLRWEFQR